MIVQQQQNLDQRSYQALCNKCEAREFWPKPRHKFWESGSLDLNLLPIVHRDSLSDSEPCSMLPTVQSNIDCTQF